MDPNGRQLPVGTRIAHLIESDGPGGAEQILASLLNELARRGYQNTLFFPRDGAGWLAARIEDSSAEVVPYSLGRSPSARFARWLTKSLKTTGAQIAHSHEFSMAFYGACAASVARVPHLITMHGSRYYAGHPRRSVALRLAAGLSGRTIAVSGPLRRALIDDLKLPASKVEVILNGASLPSPRQITLRRDLALTARDELMVSVANLYPVKGHTHLIHALRLLKAAHPRLHLALAGRGPLHGDLSRQATGLGLQDRVHFLGLRADVPNLLRSADLFVLPSLSEGLPLALLEAMLAGAPVVATHVGEIPEVLGDGVYGLTVPPADAVALAEAIHRILDDPEEACAMGERARVRAEARFTVRQMVDAYVALYGELFHSVR